MVPAPRLNRSPRVEQNKPTDQPRRPDIPESDRYRRLEESAKGLRATQPKGALRGKALKAHEHAGAWLKYTTVGLQFVVVLLLPIGGGYWLDGKLNTLPWFTLAGFLLGAVAAMVGVIREVVRMDEADARAKDGPQSGTDAGTEER
jgi:F0F1-type ATP synthase assembly protein I